MYWPLIFMGIFGVGAQGALPEGLPAEEPRSRDQITLRDPYVLPLPEEGQYYLYGTGQPLGSLGFDAYRSRDLEGWEGPFPVFRPPAGFWGTKLFWAPEVHPYRGKYYLFGTFAQEVGPRGTQICVSERPEGPFVPVGDGAHTPRNWQALDGTLFLDSAQAPWMVFCHEWIQVEDGTMNAIRLLDDLSGTVGEPLLLLRASDAPWAALIGIAPKRGWVTDGPCLHRLSNGTLLMLWSSFGKDGKYKIGIARSGSGELSGPWTQDPEPLFEDDGGHPMLFRRLDGQLMLSLHRPNHRPERPVFLAVAETSDGLRLLEAK